MAVAQHPRAKTDDELKALRDKDGFLGVVAVPFFFGAQRWSNVG
jgi:microsomal dipeptidase-like Zn-dependent dipeptidase